MRLYRFTFRNYPSGEELSVLYLANNDWEFLTQCVGWALGVSLPQETLEEAVGGKIYFKHEDANIAAAWHEDVASYHDACAKALREKGFAMEPEGRGSWESQEVTEEEIALLRSFHAIR